MYGTYHSILTSFPQLDVDTCSNTRYFMCKMLKFAIKIISTSRVVEFPRYGISARRDIYTRCDVGFTHMRNVTVYTGK